MTAISNLQGGEIHDAHRMSMGEALLMVDRVRIAIEGLHDVDTTLSTVTLAPPLGVSAGNDAAGAGRETPPERSSTVSGVLSKLVSPVAQEFREAGYLAYDNERRDELYRISLRLGAFSDVDYSDFVDHIHEVTEPVIEDQRRQEILFRATGLPDWTPTEGYPGWYQRPNRQAYISQDKAGVYTVTDPAGKTLYAGKPDWRLNVTYTGVIPLIYKAQNELLIGLFESYAMAFVLIAGVMMILMWRVAGPLKSAPAGFLLMLPNLFPTALVFGFLAWMNIAVDIGAMMTASVALGIAVDDTVHYMAWFRRASEAGHTRKESAWIAYEHCGVAMTQTTIIAGFGMGMFAFSTFNPTMKFGVLMVPLLLTALLGDLVMLPALCVGGMGRFFRRGDDEAQPAASEVSPPPHASAEPIQPKSRIPVDHTSV